MKTNQLHVETLENRLMLSLIFDFGANSTVTHDATAADVGHLDPSDHHRPGHGGGGGPGGEPPAGNEIDLPTVAAHEFGHSLGLGHSTHGDCGSAGQPLMCPSYIGPNFDLHQEDSAWVLGKYFTGSGDPWRWNANADGQTEITYSFTPDGAKMDGRRNTNKLSQTMNEAFGNEEVWKPIFTEALALWQKPFHDPAYNPWNPGVALDLTQFDELVFTEVTDDGSRFDASGSPQGDSDFGDIRIAAHRFDGAGGTLAHAYLPTQPLNATGDGDAHFDTAENWKDLRASSSALAVGGAGVESGSGDLTLSLDHEVHVVQPVLTGFSIAESFSSRSSEILAQEHWQPIGPSTEQSVLRQENNASADELEFIGGDTPSQTMSIIEFEDDDHSSDQDGFDVSTGIEALLVADAEASSGNDLVQQRFRVEED